MTFEEILDQAAAMLERRGRVTYRALKRQFGLDDETLADLKDELIKAAQVARDENGDVLVWAGGEGTGESENRRIGEQKASPQPLTPSTQNPTPNTYLPNPEPRTSSRKLHARSSRRTDSCGVGDRR